jgi:hypothetical protein
MTITRAQARQYVAHGVDDAAQHCQPKDVPDHDRVRYVGYDAGFVPMVVAVWSCLPGCEIDADEAEDLATDLLIELKWFAAGAGTEAIFVL